MRLHYYLATGAYCSFLFWISHQSKLPGAELAFDGSDKFAHFVAYGLLSALVSTGLHRAPRPFGKPVLRWAPVLFAGLYGISDEIHQYFVPGRTFSYLDMVADVLGAAAAQAICLYYFRKTTCPISRGEQGT